MKRMDSGVPDRGLVSRMCRQLKERGHRLTAARRGILTSLVASGGHVTADELVGLVRERDPGTGRMTVYRTLDLLASLGLIRPVYQGTGAAHYIILEGGHHHHLICTGCDRIVEMEDCAVGPLAAQVAARSGFRLQGHLLEVYGSCPACREQGR